MSDKTYTVTDTPTEGDLVTTAGTVQATVQKHAENLASNNGYAVIRVNLTTGRGTVQRLDGSGRKVQVVRGRWGWKLADGHATPIRFAHASADTTPAVDPHPPVLLKSASPLGSPSVGATVVALKGKLVSHVPGQLVVDELINPRLAYAHREGDASLRYRLVRDPYTGGWFLGSREVCFVPAV